MLWIDYFRFDGEEIAFTRLEHLFPVVDKFYICEQRFVSKGVKKKALYMDTMRKRFEPYLSKIKFIVQEHSRNSESKGGRYSASLNAVGISRISCPSKKFFGS